MRSLILSSRVVVRALLALLILALPGSRTAYAFARVKSVTLYGEAFATANGAASQSVIVNRGISTRAEGVSETDPMNAFSSDPMGTNSAASFSSTGYTPSLGANSGISGILTSLGIARALVDGGTQVMVEVPYGETADYTANLKATTTGTPKLVNQATLVLYTVSQDLNIPVAETTIFQQHDAPPAGTTISGTLGPGVYAWTTWFKQEVQNGQNANSGTGAYFHFTAALDWADVTTDPLGTIVPTSPSASGPNLSSASVPTLVLTAGGKGGAPLQKHWLFNGAPLSDGGGVSGSATDTLTISGFSAAWNGAYAWVLSNAFGSDTSAVAVCEADHVSSVPLLDGQPYDDVLSTTVNVFTVDAHASGPMTYQWMRGAAAVSDGDQPSGARISGSQGPALVIADGTAAETGDYQCVVTDAFGSASTRVAHLALSTSGVGSGTGAPLRLSAGPNPVRAAASMAFNLPVAGPVQLEVLDVSGRHVATIRSERLGAGLHVSTWDLRDASGRRVEPGVYLARLVAGGLTETRRVVVLR